jgi:hypothetical protein
MPETAVLFFAAIVVIACAVLITSILCAGIHARSMKPGQTNDFICPTGSEDRCSLGLKLYARRAAPRAPPRR